MSIRTRSHPGWPAISRRLLRRSIVPLSALVLLSSCAIARADEVNYVGKGKDDPKARVNFTVDFRKDAPDLVTDFAIYNALYHCNGPSGDPNVPPTIRVDALLTFRQPIGYGTDGIGGFDLHAFTGNNHGTKAHGLISRNKKTAQGSFQAVYHIGGVFTCSSLSQDWTAHRVEPKGK